jgi:hypothetical protein
MNGDHSCGAGGSDEDLPSVHGQEAEIGDLRTMDEAQHWILK